MKPTYIWIAIKLERHVIVEACKYLSNFYPIKWKCTPNGYDVFFYSDLLLAELQLRADAWLAGYQCEKEL